MSAAFNSHPIRVLVVDDSAVVRRMVSDALNAQSDIEVVGTAVDPYAARDQLKALKPDVITLDIEMPRMDGLTFLRLLMQHHPLPVIVMSSLTSAGSQTAMDALRLGAVEVLCKPHGAYSIGDLGVALVHSVRAAAAANVRRSIQRTNQTVKAPFSAPVIPRATASPPDNPRRLILLAASTGGTEALREVLVQLPLGLPPIVIVQHIPAAFSRAFADRLDSQCVLNVREAGPDEPCLPGQAIIAPGNYHLLLQRFAGGYRTQLNQGPPVWHQRPAADVLFKSIRPGDRAHIIGGVFTGMGKDGAAGLKDLRDGGALTFAQDEASSVVYGMPKEAWENGGAERQLPLDKIAQHLVSLAAQPVRAEAHVLAR
jgi:two-component system, chemotaxis family, protein-glutamate methylesterase/glutaminase